MSDIKLPRLPDRTPVKIALSLDPELHRSLLAYAEFYRAEHGEAVTVAGLVPAMLEQFLRTDRAFARANREGRLAGA